MKTLICIALAFSVLGLASGGASAEHRSKAQVLVIMRAYRAKMQTQLQHDQIKATTSQRQDDLLQVNVDKMMLAQFDKSLRQWAYDVAYPCNEAPVQHRSKAQVLAIMRAQRARLQAQLQHDQIKAAASRSQDDLFQVDTEKMNLASFDKCLRQWAYDAANQQHSQ